MKHLRLALMLILAAFAPAARAAQTFTVPLKANDAMSKVVNDVSNALATLQSSFSGASAPTSPAPVEGQTWWNTTTNVLYHYNGAVWVPASLHVPLTSTTTTPYTLTAANGILLVDATAGAKTVTAATAVGLNGTVFTVVKVDSSSNAVTFDPDGTETISGASTFALSGQYEAITFTSDGANWQIVQSHFPVPLRAVRGGTGQTGYTAGDVLYASSTTALSKLAIGAATTMLYVSSGAPAWSTKLTYKESATDANLEISAALAGASNRVKFQAINTDATGFAEMRIVNSASDQFAFLLSGPSSATGGAYTTRQAAIAGSVSGGLLLINEGGDIVFAVNTGPNVEMMRVLSVGGVLFSNGALRDNDDFELQCDYNNDGSNKFAFYNGAATEVGNIDESGNLQMDGRVTANSIRLTAPAINTIMLAGGSGADVSGITMAPGARLVGSDASVPAPIAVTNYGATLIANDGLAAMAQSGMPYADQDKTSMRVQMNAGAATDVFPGWSADWVSTVSGARASNDSADGVFNSFSTGGVLNDVSSFVAAAADVTRREWTTDVSFRIKTGASLANVRLWFGLFSASPSGSATPAVSYAGFRYDTAADGTAFWRFCSDNGSGTPQVTVTDRPIAVDSVYTLTIRLDSNGARPFVGGTNLINAGASIIHTTTLPAASTPLLQGAYITTLAGAAKTMNISRASMRRN